MNKTHVQKLADFASMLRYEEIPARVITAAKYQLLNMVAAVHSTAASGEAACVLDAMDDLCTASGSSTVLANGRRFAPSDAALANAACSIAQDFDDIVWMGHTCHSAVFAPLAVAEQIGSSSKDLLTAVVIANEVGGRLGASCFLGPLNGQMWTFIHLAGAAAGVSSLLKLDPEKTANAISIALSQPNFPLQPGFFYPTSKLLSAAIPTATGMNAAFFARNGMTGAKDIIESKRGFWRRFSFRALPEMLEDPGSFWVLDTLTIKTYPGCHYFQTSLNALELIFKKRGKTDSADVKSIVIDTTKLASEVSHLAKEAGLNDGALTPVSVAFDLKLCASVFLHAGGIGPSELTREYLEQNAKTFHAWSKKIKVVHDPALTFDVLKCARKVPAGKRAIDSLKLTEIPAIIRRYREDYGSTLLSSGDALQSLKKLAGSLVSSKDEATPVSGLVFPSRVTVDFTDGTRVSERVDLPPGSITRAEMRDELEKKFMCACGNTLGKSGAEHAFSSGLMIEETPLKEFVKSACNIEP